MDTLYKYNDNHIWLLLIVTEMVKLIALIIIIIHSKKYDLPHGKVLGVSKNSIKCASLLKFVILQYKLHQAVGTFTGKSNSDTSNSKVMNTRLSY